MLPSPARPQTRLPTTGPAACHPASSAACQGQANYFATTDWHIGNGIRGALLAAPLLLALFAGPPVLARELESGMFRFSWTQGLGRVRWTAAKLAFLGAVVTLAALVLSLVFTWFFGPFLTTKRLTPVTRRSSARTPSRTQPGR